MKESFSLDEICVSFIRRNRFYACILNKLNKTESTAIPTMGVGFSEKGRLVLVYKKKFLDSLTLAEAQSTLEHEVLHVFYKHLARLNPKTMSPEMAKLSNIACDIAINQFLPDLPQGAVYPETYKFPKDMVAEWYFEELKKQEQKQKQPMEGDTLDDHSLWGKIVDGDGNIQGEASANENCSPDHELDRVVKAAAKELEGDSCIGDLPMDIQRELAALIKPKKRHDWKRELRIFVNSVLTVSKRLSQKRANRRFLELVDYALPGKKKDRKPTLLLARDTSGSVFCDEIQKQFLNEMLNIAKYASVTVVDCDTEIHQAYKVKKMTDFKTYKGGGGTSFVPVFEYAKKINADGFIYLTDTYGEFPERGQIGRFATKTIWVTINQGKVVVPFGKHLNIEQRDNE